MSIERILVIECWLLALSVAAAAGWTYVTRHQLEVIAFSWVPVPGAWS
jgi:hypothetical protein